MRRRPTRTERARPRPTGRAGRVWRVAWLPVLLVGLAVILEPRTDGFLLGLVLLVVALATTWIRDLRRAARRRRSEASARQTGPPS